MNQINVQFKEFDGPLDMLLALLDEKKMSISEVSISAVTEPFLNYLDTLEEADPQELSDFLVVAARLLLLKSKTLLPQFASEEDEGLSLEDQLRLYRQFVEASKKLNTRWLDEHVVSYGRVEPPVVETEVTQPDNFTKDALYESMLNLVKRLAPPRPLPQTQIDRSVSLKEKIDVLRKLVLSKKTVNFKDILSNATSKTEVIVSFLAILELVKQKGVYVSQESSEDDIVISKAE